MVNRLAATTRYMISDGTPMRLRFAIRDLLWLILAVALVVAWSIDRRNFAFRNRFVVETVQSGEPILLRDKETGEVLIKDGKDWHVAHRIPGIP